MVEAEVRRRKLLARKLCSRLAASIETPEKQGESDHIRRRDLKGRKEQRPGLDVRNLRS